MQTHIFRTLVIFTILSFTACSNEDNQGTIDLEKIRPKSETSNKAKKTDFIDSNEILLKIYENDSLHLKLAKLRVAKNSSFLNRFPHKNSGFRILMRQDTTIQIHHEFYEYLDSNQMKNAFFNWLDCNGKDCKSIKLYEETKIEPQNLLVLTTPKSIDIFRSQKNINPDEWVDFIRFTKNTTEFRHLLFQKKNQKSQWFDFKNYKLVIKTKK
jgi:hypothetical protein